MGARIVVVGSLNADLVVRVDRFPEPGQTVAGRDFAVIPGGKGANQACAAARMGGDVSMIGRVGADAHGELLRRSLASAGVDVSDVRPDPRCATGVALITVDRAGENEIVIVPGANGAFTVEELARGGAWLDGAAVLLLQLEIPLPTVQTAARMGREKRAIVILDPAPARALPPALLRLCDYVTPNQGELATLINTPIAADAAVGDLTAAAQKLRTAGARNVIVKLGARGVLLVTADGALAVPAFPVTAVDTTGAGDAFAGAFAVAACEGRPLPEALRFACAAAAASVTRAGAIASLPARPEVEALLATSG